MLKVRNATENDRLGIFKLAVAMHRETDFGNFSFDPEKAINSIGLWLHGGLMLVVVDQAEDSEEVVGMMAASKKDPWFSQDVLVSEDFFYVREDKRGSRAAFLLMKGFIDWANEVGAHHLRAGVATGTGPAAERLYEHFGMHYVGGNFSSHISRSPT